MKRYLLYIIAVCVLTVLHSCVTSDYDLSKKIDATMCFTPGGFTLGGDNSADIPLNDVIKLKESGQLTTDAEGNYLFYKKGNDMGPTYVKIGRGSLCDAFEMWKNIEFKTAYLEALSRYPGYSNLTLTASIPLDAHPDPQTRSVRELKYVRSSIPVVIQTNFVGNVSEFCNSITVTYELPSFYDLEDPSELTETIKMSELGKVHEHIIHVKGVDFTKSGIKPGERIGIKQPSGEMYIEGNITVQAKAVVNTSGFESAVKSNPQMNINVVVGTMGTTLVTGRFDEYKMVDIAPIEFTDLPEFIRDAEVVADIDNPVVRVRLENEMPNNVSLNAKMKGYRDNKEISQVLAGDEYGSGQIKFYGAREGEASRCTNVWISKKAVTIPDSVESNVVVPDMNDLIRTIPDRVDIDAYAHTDSTQVVTLALGYEYKATPSYELVAPLKTGPEMKIVYSKDINDLHDHLKDLELDGLEFTGDVQNNIPLDLNVAITPLDANGNVLENVKVSTDVIPGNSSKSVVFRLTNSDSKDVQKIYSLHVKFYAQSSDKIAGQTLNKSQDLHVSHAKITLIGAKYKLNGE